MDPKAVSIQSRPKIGIKKKKQIKVFKVRLPQKVVDSLNSARVLLKRTWVTSIKTVSYNLKSYKIVSLRVPNDQLSYFYKLYSNDVAAKKQ